MSTTSPKAEPRPRATFPSPQWWVRDREGDIAIAQAPNAAILVWLATAAIGWLGLLDDRRATLTHVGQGALIVWSLDELARGASQVRRVLGAIVLVVVLLRLFG